MKAVIVELRAADAAALTEDGCVRRVKNRNYTIGQTIEVSNLPQIELRQAAKWASAAAAALIVCLTAAWSYLAPYSYVSLDVNPSIEYQLNRFDRVIGVQAVNGDGEEIVQNMKVTNASVSEAVKTTIDQIAANGYLDEEFCGIVISTSCKNEKKADALAEQLQQSASEEARRTSSTVLVETVSVDAQQLQQAKEMGVTPGKLNLVEKLQESTEEEVKVEEWLNKSVKDIMQETQKNQAGQPEVMTKPPEQSTSSEETSSLPAGELAPSEESRNPGGTDLPPESSEAFEESGTGGTDLPPEGFPSGELGSESRQGAEVGFPQGELGTESQIDYGGHTGLGELSKESTQSSDPPHAGLTGQLS